MFVACELLWDMVISIKTLLFARKCVPWLAVQFPFKKSALQFYLFIFKGTDYYDQCAIRRSEKIIWKPLLGNYDNQKNLELDATTDNILSVHKIFAHVRVFPFRLSKRLDFSKQLI